MRRNVEHMKNNRVPIDHGSHFGIPLSDGVHCAMVDRVDLELVSEFSWHVGRIKGTPAYALCSLDGKTAYMHRIIMNPGPGLEVDHINHDTLDNRRSNLRLCTRGQNNGNLRRGRTNSSGYKGVYWSKAAKKWQAYISIGNKSRYLGIFDDAKDAALAYNVAATEHRGEFALLNVL